MNDYNLSKNFCQIIDELNQLTFDNNDLTQLDKIQH